RLQPRGWRFVSVDQFSNPRASRAAVRVDRLPRGTDVVITSRLPRFDPRDVAARPERGVRFVETVRQTRAPLPVVVGRDDSPPSFRAVERVAPGLRGRRGPTGGDMRQVPPRSDLSGRPRRRPGGPPGDG